ncbi:MAG: hypothetical protein HC817_11955, partial [Saprospiraceae bacterium]|nr:hypothetical protein [Saprospiraceae bacterium]
KSQSDTPSVSGTNKQAIEPILTASTIKKAEKIRFSNSPMAQEFS